MNSNRGEKILKFSFINLKVVLEYTKNSVYEKNMANYLFTWLCNLINIQKNLFFLDNDFNYYFDILNMYLNCTLISYQNKIRLKKFIDIIKNIEKNKLKKI